MRPPLLLVTLVLLGSCGGDDSPEQQVREVLRQMEEAAEARDVGDLMEHVSKNYRDHYGQGSDEASRYARGYFITHQQIHLLTRVENIKFPSTDEARAVVLVGMVGHDADASGSWDLATDLYRFDLSLLHESGEWRINYARWRRP